MYNRNFSSYNTRAKNSRRCGTIIFNKEYTKIIVILNRHSYEMGLNKWGLPKGSLNKNETYIECAVRETLEETGLKIHINTHAAIINISKCSYFPITLDESITTDKFNPIDKDEIHDVKWISIDSLKNNKTKHANYELKRLLSLTNINRAIRIAKNNKAGLL